MIRLDRRLCAMQRGTITESVDATQVSLILSLLREWATGRVDVQVMLLVGSWARGDARPYSDVDVVLLTDDPQSYRFSDEWLRHIDWDAVGLELVGYEDADYGAVWSRHARFSDGSKIELAFGLPNWASSEHPDPGTLEVLASGFVVHLDRDRLMAPFLLD